MTDHSVVQSWLSVLPWKQQSILFSGLRGPDSPNLPAVKAVNRWMRTVTQHNADPSKDYMRPAELPDEVDLCGELEFLTCHYVHHLADALAVIAYGHPSVEVAMRAATYHYRIAEELFHFQPESPATFMRRHRDKPAGEDPEAERWARETLALESSYLDAVKARLDGD